VFYSVFAHKLKSEQYTACDLIYTVKGEVLLKVTDSHVHCKSGDITKTVIDRDVVTTGHYEEVIYDLSNSSICNDLEYP